MKIKRFFESDQDRIKQILEELDDFITNISDKSQIIESLGAELSSYKDNSTQINQIDKSIADLQTIKNDLDNCNVNLKNVVNNLNSYKDEDTLNFGNII